MNNTERFAMNDWKPLSIDEKIFRIEEELRHIDGEREPLIDRKREIELMLTEVNDHKKQWLPDDQFSQVMTTRASIVKEKFGIEERIRLINKNYKEKLVEKDKLVLTRKKAPKTEMTEYITELRNKYMSFASDTTRVSSMRAMASKFVEEIQALLKYVD